MRRRALPPHLLFALCAAASLTSCGHSPRARWNPASRELCSTDSICYRVGPLADTWRLVRAEKHEVGFFNPAFAAVAQANATCRDDADAAPLDVLTRQLLVGYTGRSYRSQTEEMLDGRAAAHTVMDARLDGVPVVLDLYVLKRDGCIFDLSLAAPPNRYDSALPQFASFVAGFADERTPPGAPRVPK